MTRKRYIKLLMAAGWDRNEAAYKAALVRVQGRSYAEDYVANNELYISADRLNIDIDALHDAIKNATEAIWRVSKALCSGVAAFSKAYSEAINKTED